MRIDRSGEISAERMKMDEAAVLHLLHAMIDYFEAGNRETDGAAKNILSSDFEYKAYWEEVIKRLQQGEEWTGLRAPEAEIIAAALRQLQGMLSGGCR